MRARPRRPRRSPSPGPWPLDLRASSDALLLGGLYTFEQTPLGAHYSLGAYLPYVWVSVDAHLDTPLGAVRRRDNASGIGDLTLIPAMLAWKTGFWQTERLAPGLRPDR